MSEHKEYWPSEEDPALAALSDSITGNNAPKQSRIDPLAVTPSALAHGQIGQVPWALVERGDGLIFAIGDVNIPIDTRDEGRQACTMSYMLWEKVVQLFPGLGDPK